MKTIAIFNEKGGVGKTTSTLNIAACLTKFNKRVLVIEGDQQGSISKFFGYFEEESNTIYDVLLDPKYDIMKAIRETNFKDYYIIPGFKNLATLPFLIQSNFEINPYNRLEKQLRKIEDYFDYVLIDCAPGQNIITTNILKASHELLAPVTLEKPSLDAVGNLADTLLKVRENFNEDLIIRGVFATRVDMRFSIHKEYINALKDTFGDAFLPYYIRTDQQINEAADVYQPVVFFNKCANATEDYFNFTREVILKNE